MHQGLLLFAAVLSKDAAEKTFSRNYKLSDSLTKKVEGGSSLVWNLKDHQVEAFFFSEASFKNQIDDQQYPKIEDFCQSPGSVHT